MATSDLKLLDRVRMKIRVKGYSLSTEKTYVSWIKRYILFHNKRHPQDMGNAEIEAFLSHLAINLKVSASTQNQAFNSILFLYRNVLEIELPQGINAVRSKPPTRLPTVLSCEETKRVLNSLSGIYQLIAKLMYGSGLRLMECMRLRVKDIDFSMNQIIVRDGKGKKDRITVLPMELINPLKEHLIYVKQVHEQDLKRGFGSVFLPYALARKFKSADRDWIWQFVFPAKQMSIDPRTGIKRRHHIHESCVQKAIKKAAKKVGLSKPVTSHAFRHSFATHLLQDGYDIRSIQELLGHKDVSTTMIYTHVLNRGGRAVLSPLDRMR